MTPPAAGIWYTPGSRTISLDYLKKRLTGNLGCTVQDKDTTPQDADAPQLVVTHPVAFSLKINNLDSIPDEATRLADFAEAQSGPTPASEKLRLCTRRLEIGPAPDMTSASPATAQEFDPASGDLRPVLMGLTSGLNGVFQDNVNGRLAVVPRSRRSLLDKILRR